MSKSTTKGAKGATTSKTESKAESKTESKTESKAESKTESKAESKTESKAETKTENTPVKSDNAAAPAEKSTKGQAAADHSPSYFSSVSTPLYRAGWDSVFSPGKAKKT